MNPIEHNAKSPFIEKAGSLAALRGSPSAKGSGAPTARGDRFTLALAALLALLASLILTLGASSASASTAHQYERSFGPDGTNATHFEIPGPIAVDQQSNELYVADQGAGTVSKFDASGTPVEFTAGSGKGTNTIGGFSFLSEEAQNQIAVDNSCWQHSPRLTELTTPTCKEFDPSNGDFYVAAFVPSQPGNNSIKIFEEDGEAAGEIGGLGFVFGVAIDSSGDVYAGERESGVVRVFQPDHKELTSFSAPEASNLAVDSTGAVYVAPYPFSGLAVKKYVPSAFPVTSTTTYSEAGSVDPNRAFAVTVDPANDDLYVDEHTRIAQFDKEGTEIGSFASTVPGALSASEGLAVDDANENIYASDTEGERQVGVFAPPPPNPPTVGASSFANLTATSVDLQAQVNPEFFDTHYRFQYLTEAQYEANGSSFSGANVPISTPEADLGSTGEARAARAHLGGLTPGTSYRFRVVAKNQNGETASAEPAAGFTTFLALSPGLPDGRAYEMVSPAQKSGEVIAPEPLSNLGGSCSECLPGANHTIMPMQSAPDGEAVLYLGQSFSAGLAAGANEYLANRSASGWGTHGLSSAATTGNFVDYSTDLSRSVLFQESPTLSPEAPSKEGRSYRNLYLTSEGSPRPLVTNTPPHKGPRDFKINYAGANSGTSTAPAFSHVLFEANDALTAAVPGIAPEAPEIGPRKQTFEEHPGCYGLGLEVGETCNLYEWLDGQPRLVNVLPGNLDAASEAVIGSGRMSLESPAILEAPDIDHAISADGSRIFWSDEVSGQIYVRIDGRETLEVPGPGRCKASLPLEERVCFLTASADGSEVLLSNGQVYALNTKADAYEPTSDLSEGQGGFQGILGASEDLSRVYFVDTAVIAGAGENQREEEAQAGEFNLYTFHAGTTTFIGTLNRHDNQLAGVSGAYGTWKVSRANRTAQVSPDGDYLAFMSLARLSGYDSTVSGGKNCDRGQGNVPTCIEVFEYSAASAHLSCASCNPSGQRPLGLSNLSLIRPDGPFRQPQNLSPEGHGRLFFESQDTLTPLDTNGRIQDVYEWEPNGVGSCDRADGCVFLISSGHSPNDSMFMDSSASGNDAFFITREQLVAGDKDEQLDLYDTRVGGGIETSETPPCSGEACKGPLASPPPSQLPQSSIFSGPGNLALTIAPLVKPKPKPLTRAQKLAKAMKACAKKPKRQRRACQAQARKRYGPPKAKSKSKSNKGGK